MRIAVGVSGGVDSAVTVKLLQREGYDVVGVWLQIGDHPVEPPDVFKELNIPIITSGIYYIFEANVLNHSVSLYDTPNPCIRCNRSVKFPSIFAAVAREGIGLVATGHYARMENGKLFTALDADKDQSYFLYGLSITGYADHIRFPLAGLRKTRVRELAKKFGLSNWNAPDSQDVCFKTSRDRIMERFDREAKPGWFIDTKGNRLGEHKGMHRYTVGQRKVGISSSEPLYVIKKVSNSIVLGTRQDLIIDHLTIHKAQWFEKPQPGDIVLAKLRYRQRPVPAKVIGHNKFDTDLEFLVPTERSAPGQHAVLYKQDQVLGGGII